MLKIFLVEDETVIREGLKSNIPWEQYGYRFVGEAQDGEIALPLIRKVKPDVLITDIKMPFMDGLSLSRIIHQEFPKMKIIIISGYDEFEYARQAIEVGVEQYLVKPITKLTLKRSLLELKEKIEQDIRQHSYQVMFQNEMHEYEQFSRSRFFERILVGKMSVKEIYEEAAKQAIEIDAACYNLLLFSLQEKDIKHMQGGVEDTRIQEEILHYFLKHPQYVLFRCNVNSYGVLVKGERESVEEFTERGVEYIRSICKPMEDRISWYVATGLAVERLSMLPECYQLVNHYYFYRFLCPAQHVLSEDTLQDYLTVGESKSIENVDSKNMDPEVIRDFLVRGSSSEISDFVTTYLQSIHEALGSRMFRDYVVLNIRFAIIAYLESLGVSKEEYMKATVSEGNENSIKAEEVHGYFETMLAAAILIREKKSEYQGRKIMRKALKYINANYDSEALSLNSVAEKVEVSANYLSAIFSQSMQKTFIEYVTGKRMEKAKHLLWSTEKTSGEIAAEVGYKDPHYFSFVFKKTQGCSPREYRTRKKS